jgi:putative addiction module component (TIGR02574 family)
MSMLFALPQSNRSIRNDCVVSSEEKPPMPPIATSVFDLSPAEKRQLVEDMWDDLAAAPDEVPIHDWQRAELDRRKANLLAQPATGLTWDEVKRRVRACQA